MPPVITELAGSPIIGAGDPKSGSFTLAAGEGLLVIAGTRQSSSPSTEVVDGVTWQSGGGGEALTEIEVLAGGGVDSFRNLIQVFYIPSPIAGTFTLDVDYNLGSQSDTHILVHKVEDHDPTDIPSILKAFTAGSGTTSASVVVGSADGAQDDGLIVDCLMLVNAANDQVPGALQTVLHNENVTGSVQIGVSTEPGSDAGNTMSWSFSSSGEVAFGAFALKPGAAGPGTPVQTVSQKDDRDVVMTITPGANATSHTLHLSATSGFTPSAATLQDTGGANPGTLTASVPAGGVTRYVVTQAVNADGVTNSAQATVIFAPERPTGLTATPVEEGIRLDWTDAAAGTAGFMIQRRVVGNGWAGAPIIRRIGAGTVTYTDRGPLTGVSYEYRVAANNVNGISNFGNVASSSVTEPTEGFRSQVVIN